MAVKFVSAVGYVDAECPTHMWPDKSCVWLRGFAKGWSFAKYQPMHARLPIYHGDEASGFSFGLGQFAMLGKLSN